MRTLRTLTVISVAMLLALPALAAPKEKGKKAPPKCPAMAQIERMTAGMTLTDDQKAKLADIAKEFGPKVADSQKKIDSVLTPEQKKARAEAQKKAAADGKKGKELFEATQAAVKLSDDQKASMAAAQKEQRAVTKDLMTKVQGVLTPEQQEQLKKARAKK